MAKNELKEKQEQLPAQMFSDEDIGLGFEGADSESFAIPFLRILQSGSPQCKRSEGGYIKGAEEGAIINTVTNELFDGDEGIDVVPIAYSRNLVEWKPREEGGGFVASHAYSRELVDSCVDSDGAKLFLPNGNILVDTRTHYVMHLREDGAATPAIITMTSTQLKKSRQWMSMMQQKRINIGGAMKPAPMFAFSYHLTTVPESNDQGSWFGWRIGASEQVDSAELVMECKEMRKAIMEGIATADMSNAE